ncbi:CapA family protein [Acidimangrovimonas pyrenivorans]|uniref:CapA family protein n=1 Tax=Acidimangrovimonas pyrenivorans TaxID=2030798 RepID=A0ABV7AFY5_9RHOB
MTAEPIRLFLAGDVMTGRGIDQILRHPGDPRLYERYMTSAADYVTLAERHSGPIPRGVTGDYLWGELLDEIERRNCDLRIVNLETAITTAAQPEPKGINYRMNPANIGVLTAARIDACGLANNHVMDWGEAGLVETLATLERAGIACAGAGRDARAATAPAVLPLAGGGRLLLLAFASSDSGVPLHWDAPPDRPGLALLPADPVAATIRAVAGLRRPGDILLVSLHWGGNWGYAVPDSQRRLARALIGEAGAQVVFGHSSHHPKGIERIGDGIALYGCGDLINDYEGIGGEEAYRPQLGLAYFLDLDRRDGRFRGLEMLALERHRFRLRRASPEDAVWLQQSLARVPLGPAPRLDPDGTLRLEA